MKHLLAIRDLSADDLNDILALSEAPSPKRVLAGQGVGLYFEKPSARTRNSMEMAVVQLGGHPVYMQREELGIGVRESACDIARTLACYHRINAARVFDHKILELMAEVSSVPVVNLLSGSDHPLQALADVLTIRQLLGGIDGARVAFIGEANNVARSLAEACKLLGVRLTVASPEGFGFSDPPAGVRQVSDPFEAVEGVDVVYTDVWVSMGAEDSDERRSAFAPFQVGSELMQHAGGAFFMHCLPARRGQEVTADVIDGPRSAVWQQAENRMHTARGAMLWLLGEATDVANPR